MLACRVEHIGTDENCLALAAELFDRCFPEEIRSRIPIRNDGFRKKDNASIRGQGCLLNEL